MRTVYLDLVVVLNFLVDWLLLMGANRLAGYPIGTGRAAVGAVLGSFYGGACLIPGFQFLGNVLWRTVSLVLISLTAFGMGVGTLRRGVLFAFLSMALGGIAIGFGAGGFWALVGSAMVVCMLCILGFSGGHKEYVDIRLNHAGRTVRLTALHDTGNTLRDPVTGEGILVAGAEAACAMLGLSKEAVADPVKTVASGICPGVRLVPYRAVGQDHGMLLGYRFRDALVDGRKSTILVAFTAFGLEGGNSRFNALIGGIV